MRFGRIARDWFNHLTCSVHLGIWTAYIHKLNHATGNYWRQIRLATLVKLLQWKICEGLNIIWILKKVSLNDNLVIIPGRNFDVLTKPLLYHDIYKIAKSLYDSRKWKWFSGIRWYMIDLNTRDWYTEQIFDPLLQNIKEKRIIHRFWFPFDYYLGHDVSLVFYHV